MKYNLFDRDWDRQIYAYRMSSYVAFLLIQKISARRADGGKRTITLGHGSSHSVEVFQWYIYLYEDHKDVRYHVSSSPFPTRTPQIDLATPVYSSH